MTSLDNEWLCTGEDFPSDSGLCFDLMCQDSSRVAADTVACPSSHLGIFE